MLREALEALVEVVEKSQDCRIVNIEGEPPHVYGVLNRSTGEVEWWEKQPYPRDHKLYTLDDFVSAVKEFRPPVEMEDADEPGPEKPGQIHEFQVPRAALPSVFCGRGFVSAVLDEPEPRRQKVHMSLDRSWEFRFLDPRELVVGSDYETFCHAREHVAFINMLRIDLGHAVAPADLLAFRNVKILTQAERETKQFRGREALSTDVKRSISNGGDKEIPEEIALSLFVYRDLVEPAAELLQKVRIAVIVDLAAGTFTMRPICGELERAQRDTDAWVRDYLENKLGDDARVFCGAV